MTQPRAACPTLSPLPGTHRHDLPTQLTEGQRLRAPTRSDVLRASEPARHFGSSHIRISFLQPYPLSEKATASYQKIGASGGDPETRPALQPATKNTRNPGTSERDATEGQAVGGGHRRKSPRKWFSGASRRKGNGPRNGSAAKTGPRTLPRKVRV